MSRQICQVFELYQRARCQFVQSVAEQASHPACIEPLQSCGALCLLRPLLLDTVPCIQQTAALAIGRLANYSCELAQAVLCADILPQLICCLGQQNRFYKKSATFTLRAVAKHTPELATYVVNSGALCPLVCCLEEFDPDVKEGAAFALGYIARHTPELAQCVVEAGAVPLLVLCMQEPELALKRVSACVLGDIAKHSLELAQCVVDTGAICHLVRCLGCCDYKLLRQVFCTLSQIAKHCCELAEMVVEAEVTACAIAQLKSCDLCVRKNAATLLREIVKHSPELAQLVVNAGGVGAMVDYIGETSGHARLPALMMLGYVAAHSECLAMTVITCRGVCALALALCEECEDHIRGAAAWALGQVGRHTPDHCRAVACANVFPRLLQLYCCECSSEDLKTKCKKALKCLLQKCCELSALDPLLHDSPPNILKHVVTQYSKVLPHDSKARRLFVCSGGLKKLQEICAEPGSELAEAINTINCCFPEEIVRYYTPGYPEALLDRVECQPEGC